MLKKSSIRHMVVNSGLYKPVMFFRRHLLRRYELDRVRQSLAFFKGVLKPGDLVFDVGANIGQSAEIFLKCGARVVSIEPQTHCAAELRARFSGNSRFTLVPKAVGSEPGSATLYISQYDFMSSFDKEWCNITWARTLEVPVTTLDALITEFGIPKFLKIDVEGWESQVLAGLSQRVPLLSFEYHSGAKGYATVEACLDRLAKIGELRLNLSGQEKWEFSLADWVNQAELLIQLDRRMTADPESYGDVMVKMA
ncbi:MAG TPA: FkbM family methyltransferase [Phycisphaerae bacterium]|jgi:FkbM family methyltransferase